MKTGTPSTLADKAARRLPPGVPPLLCSREESADLLGIGPSKFDELRKDNRLLRPVRIGTRVLWPYQNLVAYVRDLADGGDGDDPWGNVST